MTSLAIVRYELARNEEADIVGIIEKIHLPCAVDGYSHTIDFYVSPKHGIYSPEKLDAFQEGLITMMRPCARAEYISPSLEEGLFNTGLIVYEEPIHPTEYEDIIKEVEKAPLRQAPIWLDPDKKYPRRIEIKVFPSKWVAKGAISGRIYCNGCSHLSYKDFLLNQPLTQAYHLLPMLVLN